MLAIVTKSPRILLCCAEKIKYINPETLILYDKYKIDMTIRELSKGSIDGYKNDLFQWFVYILDNQCNKSIIDLQEDDIIEFIYFCKSGGNNSRRIKRRLSSISAFYKFLRRKRIVKENIMEFVERPRKDTDVVVQTFLTENQVLILKSKLKELGNLQMQVYALLSLSTMARVNAVSNISWVQIDLESRTVNDVLEKEGNIVTLYFNNEVKELLIKLKLYRSLKGIDDKGWLFCTFYRKEYKKARKSTLQDWSKRIGALINVPTLHAHDFRHTGAQLLKLKGCPIETISELLNHASIDVTRKYYLRQDKEKMSQEKDKYDV
jgi:site-specific recombinase XerD